jgi:hypothetical protein
VDKKGWNLDVGDGSHKLWVEMCVQLAVENILATAGVYKSVEGRKSEACTQATGILIIRIIRP